MYDFNKVVDRKHTSNIKYDLRDKFFGRADVLPMWVADMDFETPDFIRDAVIKRAQHSIYGYSFRSESYFQSIVDWVQKRHNWSVNTDWIVFSPGIVPALNFSTLSFSNKGDSIIVQSPVYFPFFTAVTDNMRVQLNNKLVLKDGRYFIDFDDFEEKAKTADMFFLSSPHNPVGRMWTKDELLRLGQICVQNNVIIISDEIHCDLILPGNKHIPIASLSNAIADITVTCIAPSKTFNMAGLSTSSVIISNKNLRDKFEQVLSRYHLSHGNIFGTVASEAGYNHGARWVDELMQYVNNNYREVEQALLNSKGTIRLISPDATYLAWLDFRNTGYSDEQIKNILVNKARLGLSHGPIFGEGGQGFQRMNLATPHSLVKDAIERLITAFNL
ncbi:MAG: putative C-S lyase [Bacteroidetes bacterium]|nr:putative C-S lyase [Bacteroidota bacterium]